MKTASSFGKVAAFVAELVGKLFKVHAADQFHGR